MLTKEEKEIVVNEGKVLIKQEKVAIKQEIEPEISKDEVNESFITKSVQQVSPEYDLNL